MSFILGRDYEGRGNYFPVYEFLPRHMYGYIMKFGHEMKRKFNLHKYIKILITLRLHVRKGTLLQLHENAI